MNGCPRSEIRGRKTRPPVEVVYPLNMAISGFLSDKARAIGNPEHQSGGLLRVRTGVRKRGSLKVAVGCAE